MRRSTRCSQWRNRAGFSPASLFTRCFKAGTLDRARVAQCEKAKAESNRSLAVAALLIEF